MRKVIILTSALALLGAGSAMAQNFKVSDPNAGPDAYKEHQIKSAPVDRVVTSGIGQSQTGFSAAQGFGPSDASDLPAPRFQLDNAEPTVAPSSTQRIYNGYNASDAFEPS
ncbi:hypothetical protein [Chelativorans salis]|uniref:Uncharacterized protein n=1 Tax=Chelativorans salis TaxID=2978478 RepID=A0ABT2LTZ8_9HYPH|nr:hypothetical protein [Chelativorans sp. EGI FJ00035]MCT7378011.1 hypothetical protein [Chelativorans sp. EGI FJ00035]